VADFLPWFPFDFDDFVEGTPAWEPDERWMYLCLLREQWRRGWIPNEPKRLHHFTSGVTSTRFQRMWAARIAAKFQPVDGHPDRLINLRMAAERSAKEVEIAARRRAGALGGAARAKLQGDDAQPPATAPAQAGGAAPATAPAQARGQAGAMDRSHGYRDIQQKTPDTHDSARARVVLDDEVWGLGLWELTWRNTLQRSPADRYKDGRDRWRDLVERIGADAGMLRPPMAPVQLAEAMMRALPAYAAHAAQQGDKVPSVSVAAFEGWYATLLAWVERTRPRAKVSPGAAPATPAAAAAAPTADELAATMDEMRRLGFSGRQLGDT